MGKTINDLPITRVTIDAANQIEPLELWRHTLGHGGINGYPLPQKVIDGAAQLQPQLIRIFIQEFFDIYPDEGRFNWTRLDAYMDSFEKTGAKLVAAICIKPPILYPQIDQGQWKPNDTVQWQQVIRQLVKRYSIDRPLVTYWEIGNEVDIGEDGGCPYLITDPADYFEYYKLTIAPILEVFPQAKVGGPGSASVYAPVQSGFVDLCRTTDTPLHFISHHLYSSEPGQHAQCVRHAREMVKDFDHHVEILVTEFSPMFDKASTQDQALEPHRAAAVATAILEMMEAGADWSFHYHLWDQVCLPDDFRPFFSEKGLANMLRHWNEIPHRFGLFGVNQQVRPQYFLYRMLQEMNGSRLHANCEHQDIQVLASAGEGKYGVLLIHGPSENSSDCVVALKFTNLRPGLKKLVISRIDSDCRWNDQTLEMQPVETRDLWAMQEHEIHVYTPNSCVALVHLEDLDKS